MKNLFKEHSPYFIILTLGETIVSIIATLSFIYTDSLTYSKSLIIQAMGIEKLLESMYTSTWWALVLLLLFFVSLFSIMTIIYKDLKYYTISFGCLIELLILSINLANPIKYTLMNVMIFIPIIVLNIIAYNYEKKKLQEKPKTRQKNK